MRSRSDLGDVVPSLAGPKRPQDRVLLTDAKPSFEDAMEKEFKKAIDLSKRYKVEGANYDLGDGDVVIAAITSCTNTSNPSVMIGAGLLARNAVKKGLKTKPWVKTSLAPGSQVVAEYLEKAAAGRSRRARLQPGRLRLHHLHRQFRSARSADLQRRSTTTISSRSPCSRATAISRAASIRMCAPIISPRRRWSWPMRWRARCLPISSTSRSAMIPTASRSI